MSKEKDIQEYFDEVIDNYLEGAKEKKGLFGKRGK